MYYVYKILIDNQIRYIGYTKDMAIREKQHNYLCFTARKNKILYNNIRKDFPNIKQIKLKLVKRLPDKLTAKRYECLLILTDYFSQRKLWQRVPRITDV